MATILSVPVFTFPVRADHGGELNQRAVAEKHTLQPGVADGKVGTAVESRIGPETDQAGGKKGRRARIFLPLIFLRIGQHGDVLALTDRLLDEKIRRAQRGHQGAPACSRAAGH